MAAVLSTQTLPIYETSSNTVQQAPPTTPPVSEVNYLQRSVENITKQTQNHHTFMGNTHKTLAIAAGIVFAAAVITSIVVTAIFAPASIPIAALGAFCITPVIQNFISRRISASQGFFANAEQCQDIRNELDKLPKTRNEFVLALSHKGINLAEIQDEKAQNTPLILAPVLAHYNYWHDQAIKFQAAGKKARIEQAQYSRRFPGEDQETMATNISKIRVNSIAYDEQSLIAKTNAAFYLGILRNPGFSKEASEFMHLGTTLDIGGDIEKSRIILGERAVASRFSPNKDYLIEIHHNNRSTETLTRSQVKKLTEAQLSAKLFG